jgi:hypothetical protein
MAADSTAAQKKAEKNQFIVKKRNKLTTFDGQ